MVSYSESAFLEQILSIFLGLRMALQFMGTFKYFPHHAQLKNYFIKVLHTNKRMKAVRSIRLQVQYTLWLCVRNRKSLKRDENRKTTSALGSENLGLSLVSTAQQLLTFGNVLPVNEPRFFMCKIGINTSTSLSFH